MSHVTLSATPKGNGYQATVSFAGGVSLSSAETYPSISEAVAAAAMRLLSMTDRLDALDESPGMRASAPFS
ncbi:hypothetical protein [Sphingobium sp. RAC03]|uniref:hypothetical protein n=1 Tax=Sphingobium sp. RAC03 TaxID=1843368 RepID=UPI00083D5A12|nr:hypothetical protein [Sphingobium sp. RAC03]AOF98555.1 hypothetical protein BSY17_4033 [Sphingobium sp. RAC03]